MKEVVDKLVAIEREVAAERGDFTVFALFLREDSTYRWDLLVAATWLERDRKEGFRYLVGKLSDRLAPEELDLISRVVVLDRSNPGLKAVHKAVSVEHGQVEVVNCVFFGMRITHAYIITSRRPAEETPQPEPAADGKR